MSSGHSVVDIRFQTNGVWEADEGQGVHSSFSSKEKAIDYGTQRLAFRRGELRIHSEDGRLERTIAFNEAGDPILRH